MSFRSMLKHRCHILVLEETMENGSPVVAWVPLAEDNVPIEYRCFLDLTFLRRGKDPQWTPEAGRPADRPGVFFALGDIPLRAGDRIQMVRGPEGIFETTGAFDEAWRPRGVHHIEVGVAEVAAALTRSSRARRPRDGPTVSPRLSR